MRIGTAARGSGRTVALVWRTGRRTRPKVALTLRPFTAQSRSLITKPHRRAAVASFPRLQETVTQGWVRENPTDLVVTPDGSRTFADLLNSHQSKASAKYFAARTLKSGDLTGPAFSLHDTVPADAEQVRFLSLQSDDCSARQAFWLTAAYLLGAALTNQGVQDHRVLLTGRPRLLEESAVGGSGFVYEYVLVSKGKTPPPPATTYQEALETTARLLDRDVARPIALSGKDMQVIKKQVSKLAASDATISIRDVPRAEALQLFESNPFKVESIMTSGRPDVRILEITSSERGRLHVDLAPDISIPYLKKPQAIAAFHLTEWSTGTFTPSDPSASLPLTQQQQPLNVLRGLALTSREDLDARLEEQRLAIETSHHNIGRAQGLFLTHKDSPGSPLMLPHGVRLGRKIERVIRDLYDVFGYDEVVTPQVYKRDLWVRSGHWDNYRDDMFGVESFGEKEFREACQVRKIVDERKGCCGGYGNADGSQSASPSEEFGLKPMNCPGHCLIFASRPRKLKDLPIRYSEWSPLHRNESSGSLSGLTRVRRFHQDDAHVFCAPEQVEGEIREMLSMLRGAYDIFGFLRYELVLSTRPPNFIGTVDEWDQAEASLRLALDSTGMSWKLNEADGAFYGPKIDVRLVDNAGRKHQTATIQLDFQLPQRFDLTYDNGSVGIDNASSIAVVKSKSRPVMIHRAILGSVERFMAILIESTGGKWPFWLSPRQACVIPVSSASPEDVAYAHRVARALSIGGHGRNPGETRGGPCDHVDAASLAKRHTHKFHVDVDKSTDTLPRRIRRAVTGDEAYNFVVIVGSKEREAAEHRAAGGSDGPEGMEIAVRARPIAVDASTSTRNAAADSSRSLRLLNALASGRRESQENGCDSISGAAGLRKLLADEGEGVSSDHAEWQWDVKKLRDIWILMDDFHL